MRIDEFLEWCHQALPCKKWYYTYTTMDSAKISPPCHHVRIRWSNEFNDFDDFMAEDVPTLQKRIQKIIEKIEENEDS